MCECLRVVFVCVSVFVREIVYVYACVCVCGCECVRVNMCDVRMYVCV